MADGAVAFAHFGRIGVEDGAVADVAAVAATCVRLLGSGGRRHDYFVSAMLVSDRGPLEDKRAYPLSAQSLILYEAYYLAATLFSLQTVGTPSLISDPSAGGGEPRR